MNHLKATITHIASEGLLHIVTFDCAGIRLQMMSLELSAEIKVGVRVLLTIKSTYIALAKSFEGEVSYTNIIPADIIRVDNGTLLSSIQLQVQEFVLESIITVDASRRMGLIEGDAVQLLVKASEFSIVEVVDG